MLLDFESTPCNVSSCSIDCIARNTEKSFSKEILNCLIRHEGTKDNISRINLNEIIEIEYNTHDFIVIACRNTSHLDEERIDILRQTSDGTTQLDVDR